VASQILEPKTALLVTYVFLSNLIGIRGDTNPPWPCRCSDMIGRRNTSTKWICDDLWWLWNIDVLTNQSIEPSSVNPAPNGGSNSIRSFADIWGEMLLSSLNTDLCLFLIIFGFFHLFHLPHDCRLRGHVKSWSKLSWFFSAVSGDMPVLHKMPIVQNTLKRSQ